MLQELNNCGKRLTLTSVEQFIVQTRSDKPLVTICPLSRQLVFIRADIFLNDSRQYRSIILTQLECGLESLFPNKLRVRVPSSGPFYVTTLLITSIQASYAASKGKISPSELRDDCGSLLCFFFVGLLFGIFLIDDRVGKQSQLKINRKLFLLQSQRDVVAVTAVANEERRKKERITKKKKKAGTRSDETNKLNRTFHRN